MPQLAWVDLALLGVLALSALLGLCRGLIFEVMSLAGWVVAYVAAQAYAPLVAGHLPVGTEGSAARMASAYFVTFVAVLLAWALLAKLVRMAVAATPLTVPDRLLGGVFGVLRGLVLLLAVVTVVSFTPAVRSTPWMGSTGAAWLAVLLQGIKPMLPEEVSRHLPAG